jgi:hypothetical protein
MGFTSLSFAADIGAARRTVAMLGVAVALAGSIAAPAWAVTTNLAKFGTATATGEDFGASIADGIDGNRNGDFGAGSVFYANANAASPPLFYEVDLGVNAYIDRVQVLRRTDADQGVFGNMRLTIYDDDGAGNPGAVTFTQDYLTGAFGSGGFEFGTWGTTAPGLASAQGAHGRHVRLERIDNNYWLTFAEFEVIGSTSPLAFTDANNIALNKPVTALSGPGFDALIGGGNDGNIDGNFGGAGYRPVYHSALSGVGEHWQIDLGSMTPLDHLELFSRTSEERQMDGTLYSTTTQFKVSVLDSSQAVVDSFIFDHAPPSDPTQPYDDLINTAGKIGQFIRVETTKDEFLAFAELRAWAGTGSIFQAGDFNHDGSVNSSDLGQWKDNFGLNDDSDANGDGDSDGGDFLTWQQKLGGAPVQAATGAVPEPTSAALLLFGVAAAHSLTARRRRRGACAQAI